jgi:hypothetical protein
MKSKRNDFLQIKSLLKSKTLSIDAVFSASKKKSINALKTASKR